jgi:DUF1365 family protein
MHSALYIGRVKHRRVTPRAHEFTYPLFMVSLDLAELTSVFKGRWLWAVDRAALASFRRRDHLGDPSQPLDTAVRELVEARTGKRPAGAIRLLTHLRYYGYCFNPVSFYYCFDAADERVEFVVAEVNNTPWGEQHCYVMQVQDDQSGLAVQRWQLEKQMHVSPFMPMDLDYDWSFSQPGKQLAVYMRCERESRLVFDATLDLHRKPITALSLAGVLVRFPWMTARVVVAIHWQALRLWLKRVPVHTHPANRTAS